MVNESAGPSGGDVSQNCVCRKWPDGWLTQHVLIVLGGGEGHESVGGLGQVSPWMLYWYWF